MKNNHPQHKKGQILVVFAISVVALMAFLGLAVDGGMVYVSRQNMQSAADAAALAAGYAKIKGRNNTLAAQGIASRNGYPDDPIGSVVVNCPPDDPRFTSAACSEYVQVKITAKVNTFFIHLVYPGISQNSVEAIVHATPAHTDIGGNNVVTAMSETACNALIIDGGVHINVSGGGNVFSNSSANSSNNCSALHVDGSSGSILVSPPGQTLVVGQGADNNPHGEYGFSHNGQLTVNPAPVTDVTQVHYSTISSYNIPVPRCDDPTNFDAGTLASYTHAQISSGPQTLTPGVYDSININSSTATLYLEPGLYCITHDVYTKANLIGNGVLLVIGGKYDIGGNTSLTLVGLGDYPYPIPAIPPTPTPVPTNPPLPTSIPTVVGLPTLPSSTGYVRTNTSFSCVPGGTGMIGTSPDICPASGTFDFKGYLILLTGTSSLQPFSSNGSGTMDYTGTIYAPRSACTLEGNNNQISSLDVQILCDTIHLTGSGTLNFTNGLDTNGGSNGYIELTK